MKSTDRYEAVGYLYSMKKVFQCFNYVFLLLVLSLGSCSNPTDISSKIAEVEKKYQDSISVLQSQLEQANSQIELLKFPAEQRLNKISELFKAEDYNSVKREVTELKRIFPNAKEIEEAEKYLVKIAAVEKAKEAEEQRLKALGFKALNTSLTVRIDENKIDFSNMKIGPKFSHDVYPTYSGSEWREHTADKGCSYISFNMDVTSSSKDPNIPTIAFYSVDGDRLKRQATFWVYFARWSDYGCYLGNEPDLKNDFSKVNTVKFRVGISLEDHYFKEPYVIVLKKANTLSRHYDKYENPPVSYTGDDGYPYSLKVDDFSNGQYVALKIANL